MGAALAEEQETSASLRIELLSAREAAAGLRLELAAARARGTDANAALLLERSRHASPAVSPAAASREEARFARLLQHGTAA